MTQTTKPAVLTFGAFTLDAAAGELRKHGVRLRLGGQPLEILRMLVERPGEVVTREELRAALWAGDTFVDFDHSLNAAVNKLREALGDSAENPRYIETLPRRGYRFLGPLGEAHTNSNGARTADGGAATHVAISPQRRAWAMPVALLALPVLVAGAVALNVGGLRERLFRPATPAAPAVSSLVVLPFGNLSDDPEQEYFADGMTEELITQLAQIRALRVISRTSAMQYKGARKPLPQIARELGVQAVVEGSVMRSGDRVRITAQLVDAAGDRHLWAETYERDLADIIALQRDVARAITQQIRVQVTPQERAQLASPAPVNPKAYQEYLQGRYFQHKAIGWATGRAIGHYRAAIALDANYVPAYVGLAHSLIFAPVPRRSMPEAKQAAQRALQLAPNDPEAHVAMGVVRGTWEWDWTGAEASFQRALQLDPNNAYAHHSYSILLASLGRFDEALEHGRQALELDPLAARFGHTLGRIYYFARRYDDAMRQYQATLEKDPTDYWSFFFMGIVSQQQGDDTAAAKYRFRACALTPGFAPEQVARFQKAYERNGYAGFLRETIAAEMEAYRKDELISSSVALTYCRLGEKEKALEWLGYAFDSHTRDLVYLNVEPAYDSIRSDPRFQALLARMKFPPSGH